MGSWRSKQPAARPSSLSSVATSVPSSRSGGVQRPPQIPDGGRCSSSRRPQRSSINQRRAQRTGFGVFALASREFRLGSVGRCLASARQRTGLAVGLAARAEGRAQVHDCLRVVGCSAFRGVFFRQRPELLCDSGITGITGDGVNPGEYPFNVAVEDGCPAALADRRNGASCASPDAGQRAQGFDAER